MPRPTWREHLTERRIRALRVRSQVEKGIIQFFEARKFENVRTPLLVRSPGMEPHIRPFRVTPSGQSGNQESTHLPTSPEFAMKKLLSAGLERIFQICPAFRVEPESSTHLPEFTLLEFYRAHADFEAIQTDTERLFEALAIGVCGSTDIVFQKRQISVKAPWPRHTVRELFKSHAGIDLVHEGKPAPLGPCCKSFGLSVDPSDTWDDLYFKLWLNIVEPKLPADQAVFVERYPGSQSALAVLDHDPDGSVWAKRFEVYAGGLELGNAFEELTDPIEQRTRFEKDMALREKIYGTKFPKSPIDEEFIRALEEGLPPCSGIALGVDRMIMLFADEPEIQNTVWLPGYVGSAES